MLDGKILIKDWAKNALGLRETIFKGLIKPLLCDSLKEHNVQL
jgi:hypothetical protein